jgi:ubiquinone/menaquinone biosynthesis C-methylase UbiE
MPETHPVHAGQDLIWDYFQNEAPEHFEASRARLRHLVQKLSRSQVVLNVGCGSGIFEKLAMAQEVDIYSLDPSERSIQHLRETLRLGDKARVGYIQALPFSDSHFDVVVVTEVLEHLSPAVMDAGLVEIRRVLKQGGRVLGTVPSGENLKDQMVVCPWCGKQFHKWGHEQSFDSEKMQRILAAYFQAIRIIEMPFFSWTTLNWRGKSAAVVKLMLWKLGVHGSSENLVFEGVKPDIGPARK